MIFTFKAICKDEILMIIPLLKQLNTTTAIDILEKRVLEMKDYQNYECVGVFDDKKLIGIAGL